MSNTFFSSPWTTVWMSEEYRVVPLHISFLFALGNPGPTVTFLNTSELRFAPAVFWTVNTRGNPLWLVWLGVPLLNTGLVLRSFIWDWLMGFQQSLSALPASLLQSNRRSCPGLSPPSASSVTHRSISESIRYYWPMVEQSDVPRGPPTLQWVLWAHVFAFCLCYFCSAKFSLVRKRKLLSFTQKHKRTFLAECQSCPFPYKKGRWFTTKFKREKKCIGLYKSSKAIS